MATRFNPRGRAIIARPIIRRLLALWNAEGRSRAPLVRATPRQRVGYLRRPATSRCVPACLCSRRGRAARSSRPSGRVRPQPASPDERGVLAANDAATTDGRFTRGPSLSSTLAAAIVVPVASFATRVRAATSVALSFRATCFASIGRARVCTIRRPLLGGLASCTDLRLLDGACGCQALPRYCIRRRGVGAVWGKRDERDPGDDARYDGRFADRRHRVSRDTRRSGWRCARRLDGRSRRHHLVARARGGAGGRLRVACSARHDVVDFMSDRRRDGNGRGRNGRDSRPPSSRLRRGRAS